MPVLSPTDAAYAADRIYNIINENDLSLFGTQLNDKFDISKGKRFEGTAGALIFKYRSGFGLLAKGTGIHKDEALIAIRGTSDGFRDLFLTDFNVGLNYSSTGKVVHSGFNKVFNSFERDLSRFFIGYNPSKVHCVGHSLGGGLATLAADWVAHKNIAEPCLYTFGSPRVGNRAFAESLTEKLGATNIYRVYHKTDIVSMVPMWPFNHIPLPGIECYLESPGTFPGIAYHKIERYVDKLSGKKNWDNLRKQQPELNFDREIDGWLNSDSPVSFSVNTVNLISKAIIYVLKKILKLTGIALQNTLLTGPMTLLDLIAATFHKAVKASKEAAGFVENLIRRILSTLGKPISMAKNLTSELIRWVLNMLTQSVYRLANTAIELVHR